MTVNYLYRCGDGEKMCGPFECDKEDFKNFFKYMPKEVMWIRVIVTQVWDPFQEWGNLFRSYVWIRGKGWRTHLTDIDNYDYVKSVRQMFY